MESKTKTKTTELTDAENRLVVARGGGVRGQVEWAKGVKRNKLPVIK